MVNPIRVLHVFGALNIGGAESRTMDIYRNIDKSKIQFDFAIHTHNHCYFTDEILSMGGKIFSFPRFVGRNYKTYKLEWRKFFEQHPEYKIIHGHQTSTGFIYLKEAKRYSVPVRISHSRNSNKDNIVKRYTSKLSRFYSTHQFAVSKLAGISEFGKKAVDSGKVIVIPNAIDTKKYFYDGDKRNRKRFELGLQDYFVVGHIGRFHPQKNHKFLLEIFKCIKEKQEKSKLVLVGDGPLRSQIENQIQKLGIEDSVMLLGSRSDVPEILQAMDVLVFPSLYEGLPGVVLEAQAAGLPCIVSDTVTEEVAITNLVKYLSLKRETYYWANVVLQVPVVSDRSKYNHIVESKFGIERTARWYENFYLESVKQAT